MSLRRCIVVLLMLLAFMPARAQTMYGYDFTTGVDSSMWITLTNPDTLRTYEQTLVDYSPFVELDFPFGFLGTEIHSISAHNFGCLICNRAENSSPYGVSSLFFWLCCPKLLLDFLLHYVSMPDDRKSGLQDVRMRILDKITFQFIGGVSLSITA